MEGVGTVPVEGVGTGPGEVVDTLAVTSQWFYRVTTSEKKNDLHSDGFETVRL